MTIPGAAVDVSTYEERVARHVPGVRDLHRMAGLLLAESAPPDGCILVLGAGGGMELRALAAMEPDWRFDGVAPSPDMLDQARTAVGKDRDRVTFHQGYIEDAPEGPFDGATCFLTLHFLPRAERLRTLREIHRRLRPGARFVAAHHSYPRDEADIWLSRNARLLHPERGAEEKVAASVEMMKANLPALSPEQVEALLREAGFTDVRLFYAGFTFRGWVGTRG